MQETNKQLLKESPAGMRLIAQTTLYNSGAFPRLKLYIGDNYHPSLLEERSVSAWLAVMKAQYRLVGKLRVRQVIVADKYEVVVLMESEWGQRLGVANLSVEEDFPHKVLRFDLDIGTG